MERYLKRNLKSAGGIQAGYRTQQVIDRDPRSYCSQREVQIMRHIATMLFFYLKYRLGLPAKEIQCMLVFHPANANQVLMSDYSLLIGENDGSHTLRLKQILNDVDLLRNVLSQTYGAGNDLALSKRFKKHFHNYRYHQKEYLEKARNNIDLQSRKTALIIYDLLMTKKAHSIDVSQYRSRNPLITGGLYVVHQTKKIHGDNRNTRHIEEKFIDILEHYDKTWACVIIAGKKRPCGSCYSRINHFVTQYQQYLRKVDKGEIQLGVNHVNGYVVYNSHPGNLWKGRLQGQSAAVQQHAMQCFGSNDDQKHSHITIRSSGRQARDICTESCSDPWA